MLQTKSCIINLKTGAFPNYFKNTLIMAIFVNPLPLFLQTILKNGRLLLKNVKKNEKKNGKNCKVRKPI
jgi:hypothetical protein